MAQVRPFHIISLLYTIMIKVNANEEKNYFQRNPIG